MPNAAAVHTAVDAGGGTRRWPLERCTELAMRLLVFSLHIVYAYGQCISPHRSLLLSVLEA